MVKTKRTPAEETSEFDFREGNDPSKSAKRWRKCCLDILGTLDVVLAEAFFRSSPDIRVLEARYGRFGTSRHLGFCATLNIDLIETHKPTAVIVVGIGSKYTDLIVPSYGLHHVRSVSFSTKSGRTSRLIEHYRDSKPAWIFTKHWTGARPSNGEKHEMRTYIAELGAIHP
jgi:hypothetical protein